jgi:putative tricarboxylic transport membrane protein
VVEGLLSATADLLTWPGPLLVVAGVVIGLFVGVLPGLGGSAGMALLLPLTFGMSPTHGIAFLMAIGTSSGLGGQITSILVSIPGDPPNAVTTIDGYQMTRQGKAAEALGAATFGSVFGAIFGVVCFLVLLPFARNLVLAVSYPEFFMIALVGLLLIAAMGGGNFVKGAVAVGAGLLVSFIGLDPVVGNPRFTFGQLYLWDGIDIVPALIGLFAGAEMLMLFSQKGIHGIAEIAALGPRSRMIDGLWSTIRAWRVVLVSSLIGFIAGIIPGISGTLGSFLAYGQAKRMSKHPEEFGRGAVEGVIAPETANDSDKGGAMLPTLAFGIPGGVMWAVLLAGLLIQGVPAGPNLLRGDLHIVYVVVVAALIPRLIAAGLVLLLGDRAIAITRTRGDVLAPLIALVAIVGVYALRNDMLDVLVLLVFCYVGYAMQAYGFSRLGFIIALVLGGLIESSLTQTLATFGPSGFFTRPIALVLLVVSVAIVAFPIASTVRSILGSRPAAGAA